jgi:hypothetical protein
VPAVNMDASNSPVMHDRMFFIGVLLS